MINTYTKEYIQEHMKDFQEFVSAVDEFCENKDMSMVLLGILYISMKRST